ncbi:MarR family winged helix-turn-helix transcriptional regulator [Streptomyces sp. H27-C3]|uniref:MarR family winged helix-turn-helix transcriptional regulator n=1 Tax=Streptomyces sp. H27-C3 TaxID=3046305 RepID=UPI0024BA4E1E|nr:MarR family winged helix-turn-helix transcriptional regulator [Streptomyces sp. H27-C3]MDJ0463993.1 MarR family winged helix-turn-helix transcriptional regulator [Streptomyces sp. H27-C3]
MNPVPAHTTDQAPADPAATDDMPTSQPIGYWAGLVHTAVTGRLRDAMARIDATQPQYWVLNRVHGGPAAPSREEVGHQPTPLADGPHEITRVIDELLHRGWLRTDTGQRLHLTDTGEAARVRLRELATGLRAEIHQGISDKEYVAALKVLRTMLTNIVDDPGVLARPRRAQPVGYRAGRASPAGG